MDRIQSFIKAVIFDLDGLMIDSEPLSWKAWNRMLEPFGSMLNYQDYQSIIGANSEISAEVVRNQVNLEMEIDDIVDRHDALRLAIIAEEAEPMEGLLSLVHGLEARGIPFGVASNSPTEYVATALERIGLMDRVRVAIGVDLVKYGKPAADIFIKAAQMLEVAPSFCLVFEDSPIGLESALAAGMRCVVVPNQALSGEEFTGAFARFGSLGEVVKNLTTLLN